MTGAMFCTGRESMPVKRGSLSNDVNGLMSPKLVLTELSKMYDDWSWTNVRAPPTRSYSCATPPRTTVLRSPKIAPRSPLLNDGFQANPIRGEKLFHSVSY